MVSVMADGATDRCDDWTAAVTFVPADPPRTSSLASSTVARTLPPVVRCTTSTRSPSVASANALVVALSGSVVVTDARVSASGGTASNVSVWLDSGTASLVDTIVDGITVGMSGRCSGVLTTSLTAYACG